MDACPYPSRRRSGVSIWTGLAFPTQPKAALVYIIALRYKNSTSYEQMRVARSYHEIVTGETRSTIDVIVVLELDKVSVSFGSYPSFDVCFGLHYLRYRD